MSQRYVSINDFSRDELDSIESFSKDWDSSDFNEKVFTDDINSDEDGSGQTAFAIKNAKAPINPDGSSSSELSESLKIVMRREWGARNSRFPGITPMGRPAKSVILRYFTHAQPESSQPQLGHVNACRTDEQCRKVVLGLQFQNKKDDMRDIAANFLISDDGTVYEGRGWMAVCESPDIEMKRIKLPKTKIDPQRVYNISYIGNYDADQVTPEMKGSLKRLLEVGVQSGFLEKNYDFMEMIEQGA